MSEETRSNDNHNSTSTDSNNENDITSEVTALSTKLIQAIDRQADLEDQVQVLRKELDVSRRDKLKLEDRINNGDLIEKSVHDQAISDRDSAQKESSRLEGEIEELTGSLFDEANKMVSDAKRETSEWAKRNTQLQLQIEEKNSLLENMQQQLKGLKSVLQDLTDQQEEQQEEQYTKRMSSGLYLNTNLPNSNGEFSEAPTPSGNSTGLQPSPFAKDDIDEENNTQLNDDNNNNVATTNNDSVSGGYFNDSQQPPPHMDISSFSLSSLVRPIVRRDLPSYRDFKSLSNHINHVNSIRGKSPNLSQMSSTNNSNSNLSSTDSPPPQRPGSPGNNNNSPSSSATSRYSFNFHSVSLVGTPSAGQISGFNNSTANQTPYVAPSLKEFRFFKRTLTEDIEPTLRLDLSPGLSWLGRRTVMSSILDGSAVVEPISGVNEAYKFLGSELLDQHHRVQSESSTAHLYKYPTGGPPVATRAPCKLCGENRTGSLLYARMHNLRTGSISTSNNDNQSDTNTNTNNNNSTTNTSANTTNTATTTTAATGTNSGGRGFSVSFGRNRDRDPSEHISTNSNSDDSTNKTTATSTGHPLCYYCVNRVRTVCDFVMFIRSIRDGVWKTDDEQSLARGWEECIRLRERMFWARTGGSFPWGAGPIPGTPNTNHSSSQNFYHNNNNSKRNTLDLAERLDKLGIYKPSTPIDQQEPNKDNNEPTSEDEEEEFLDSYADTPDHNEDANEK